MKTNFVNYIFCVIMLSLPVMIQAQVTIGGGFKPMDGTILELKEFNDTEAQTGGRTANRGLLMPRVKLEELNSLKPMIAGGGTADHKKEHTGLIVYNLTANTTFKAGLYNWDGEKWRPIASASLADILASNGLTKTGNTITLGGELTKNTTIEQGSYNFTTSGIGKFKINNNLVYKETSTVGHVLTATDANGTVAWQAIPAAAIITASNGLAKTGNNIALGGNLTAATTINQGTNDLTTSGTGKLKVNNNLVYKGTATTGQVLTATDASGTVGWLAVPAAPATTASCGLTKTGNNIGLGGNLTTATTINQGANDFTTSGTGKFQVNNSFVYKGTSVKGQILAAGDAAGTVVWQNAPVAPVITASNGLAKTGNDIQLGGTLSKATTIAQATFDVTTSGTGKLKVNNDLVYKGTATKGQILTANDATGTVVWQNAPAAPVITASNGLAKVGNDIQLGGTLSKATTINQAAFDLTTSGTGKLKVNSNLVYKGVSTKGQVLTANDATGTVVWQNAPAAPVITASNGLTKAGNDIQLGGTLSKATSLNQGAFDLTTSGTGKLKINSNLVYKATSTAGHVLTALDAAGTVGWKAIPTTANNGLAISGNTIQLGGALTKATTITQAAHKLNITSTGNNAFNVNNAISVSGDKVTIGSRQAPAVAAILDLKTQADATPATGGVTSTKGGLLLPRVSLTEQTSLKPFIASGGTAAEKAAHKGLIVYHVSGGSMTAGQKIWDGVKWLSVITEIPPTEVVQSNFFDLATTQKATGTAPSETEKGLKLQLGTKNASGQYYIPINKKGSYVFSVRIYGDAVDRANGSGYSRACYYLTLIVNGKKVDVQEFNNTIHPRSIKVSGTAMLSGTNIPAGAQVQILFSYFSQANTDATFCNSITLTGNPGLVANKTSLVYWKL